jgi:hypothetical protein
MYIIQFHDIYEVICGESVNTTVENLPNFIVTKSVIPKIKVSKNWVGYASYCTDFNYKTPLVQI